MPKQLTHIPTVRTWLQSLGVLTAISVSRRDAELRLAAYLPVLMADFPDAAFTDASLHHVAKACAKGFPTYPEIYAALREHWRATRPMPVQLPAPIPEERPPPTDEEREHVSRVVAVLTASLRRAAIETELAANKLEAASAFKRERYLTPEQLDRINPLPNGAKRA